MALLNILHFPDERLRTIAQPVEEVNDEVRTLVDDMFETMYAAPGIGLAATQVNVHQRIIVIDISEGKDQPLCLINPEITERDGIQTYEEGCLSVPGFYENVERASTITVRALDREGKEFKLTTDGEVIAVFNSPGSRPSGLTYDGTYLWNADWADGKIYKIRIN